MAIIRLTDKADGFIGQRHLSIGPFEISVNYLAYRESLLPRPTKPGLALIEIAPVDRGVDTLRR